jgi:hypothetical protein
MAKQKDRTKGLSIGKLSISTSKSKDMENGKKSKSLTVKVGDKTLYSRNKTKQRDKFNSIPTSMKEENYQRYGIGKGAEVNTFTNRKKSKSSTLNVGLKGDMGSVSIARVKNKYGRINQDVPGFKDKGRSISTNDNSGKGPSYDSFKRKGTLNYVTIGEDLYNRKGKRVQKKQSLYIKGKSKEKGTSKKSK